jgi:hypothetical protein
MRYFCAKLWYNIRIRKMSEEMNVELIGTAQECKDANYAKKKSLN